MRRLLLLVAALIVYGSLFPWHFAFARPGNPIDALLASLYFRVDRFLLRDGLLNVLLYMPLGLAAAMVARRRASARVAGMLALCLGGALSLTMEVLQFYVPGRMPSLIDVVTNSAGTAIGVFVALIVWPELGIDLGARGVKASAPALVLLSWAAYQLYPLFPALRISRLVAELGSLARSAPVWPASAVEIWSAAAGWFAVALAAEAVFGRVRLWWLIAAMAVLPARLFLAGRHLTLDECLGAALGLLLWILLRHRRHAGVVAIASAIVLRELAPFHFAAASAPFSWVPFGATLEALRQPAALTFLGKAFEYGAAVWLLRQAGMRYWGAGAAVAAGLVLMEFAQRFLPGRTPEITDSVLALLMTFALAGLDSVSGGSAAKAPRRIQSR